MNETLHIAELISRKLRGEISNAEQAELDVWIKDKPENKFIYNKAISHRHHLDKLEIYALFNKEKVRARLEAELFQTKKIQLNKRQIFSIAASILLPVLIIASYLLFRTAEPMDLAELNEVIQPGTQKAVLTLSDGTEIALEANSEGAVLKEGKVEIINVSDQLNYKELAASIDGDKMIYNTLTTPKGGRYQLQLADGTKVWLNAESSVRYPVVFSETARDVYLEGEGFFKVSKNGSKFTVHTNSLNVDVLGTEFNVSAYPDDDQITATLVEGSINIRTSHDTLSTVLVPDQQAVLSFDDNNLMVQQVDVRFFTSWMNGKIEFDNESLEDVMKRLSRWYNFEYEFEREEAKSYHFTARLDGDEKIANILEMLELTTEVSFNYNNGKVIIQ